MLVAYREERNVERVVSNAAALVEVRGETDPVLAAANAVEEDGLTPFDALHLVAADEFTVTFDADDLRHLHPDERNVAARIRDALDAQDEAIGHMPADVSPGVELRRMGLEATLDRVLDDGGGSPRSGTSAGADGPTLVQLHEDGDPLVDAAPPTDPVFVLSDHNDFPPAERDLLADRADRRVRVGPKRLHADHTISVVHNWIDTDGYASY